VSRAVDITGDGTDGTYPPDMAVKELLTVEQVAEVLGLEPAEALAKVRHGIPGTVRKNDGTFLVPAAAVGALLPPARRGPSRPVLLTADARARLVAEATAAASDIEAARQAMGAAAERRQEAILALRDGGLSVRQVAAELGVSAAVVQGAITGARRRGASSGD
jgi:DNA-binding NarL/FixJ family response regulator